MFFKWAEPSDTYRGFACLPYISGLTEPLTRLLRNNEIRVVNKPLKIGPQCEHVPRESDIVMAGWEWT